MGKKKPSLKSNVQRGFATTSVPKRQQPAPKEDEGKPDATPKPKNPPPAAPEPAATAPEVEPVSEETSELQKLVDLINPKVEKEAPRKLKTIEFNQRLAKSLASYGMFRPIRDKIVAFAKGEYVEEEEPSIGVSKGPRAPNTGVANHLSGSPLPPKSQTPKEEPSKPSPPKKEVAEEDKDPFLPTQIVQESLGMVSYADSKTRELETALTTWSLLTSIGFTQAQADIAIEYAPNLEFEEAAAYLFVQLPDPDIRGVSTFSLEPPEPKKRETELTEFASAVDETIAPHHNAISFERKTREQFMAEHEQRKQETKAAPVTTLDALPRGLPWQLWQETEGMIKEQQRALDPENPLADAVENSVEAYCTARIVLVRIDQERKRREKILGKRLDPYLAEAAFEETAKRLFAQLAHDASNLMKQAEMQPSFDKKVAAERFKERMRHASSKRETMAGVSSAAHTPHKQQPASTHMDVHARRRAEIERAMRGDMDDDSDEDPVGHFPARQSQATDDEEDLDDTDDIFDQEPSTEGSATKPRDQAETVDSDSEDNSQSILGALLDEEPKPAETQTVQLRVISGSHGPRSPRALLADALRRIDPYATHRFTPITGGSVYRSQLEIRWNMTHRQSAARVVFDTFKLTSQGCETQQLADDLIATAALNCIVREQQIQRLLSAGFRTFWDELEAIRNMEKQAFLCSDYARMQEILERRTKHPVAPRRMPRITKADATPSKPRAERILRTDDRLAQEYYARRESDAYQAMVPGREELPIAASRQEILDAVAHSQVVVLSGETGCGKSTQLPAYLLEDALGRGCPCKIYVTEPRRISAISLAERVSQELGEPRGAIGGPESYVGYAIRLDSQVGRNARLIYATTGIALRMLESSSFDEITHIIIDEVHERSIESDFLLMVLKVLVQQRPNLKVVLMSATLDAGRISDYFGGCPMLQVPGRTFPVDEYYLEDVVEMCEYKPEPNSPYVLPKPVEGAVKIRTEDDDDSDFEMSDDDGEEKQHSSVRSNAKTYSPQTLETLTELNEYLINYELITKLLQKLFTDPRFEPMSRAVLVFLPGIGEIRHCESALSGLPEFAPQRCQIHILHSTIAPEDQTAAFDPPPKGMRKVVLATNIAETGITIPDITCVIDTGRHREMRYDEKRKISRLVECFIARSNAKQRRGRAGRVQHGMCFHLFTKMRHDEIMDAHPLPEMLRLSLQELALTLKVMQIKVGESIEDALSQALDPPQAINVQRAVASLVEVQALTPNEEITTLGRHLCHMPLDVHLGKFLLIATRFRCVDAALTIAAILNSKTPFLRLPNNRFLSSARSRFNHHRSDFLSFVQMYRSWRRMVGQQRSAQWCAVNGLSQDILYQVEELRQQYLSYLADTGFVALSNELRRDLSRNRTRHGRPRLIEVPQELDKYAECPQAIQLALVAALYPKVAWIDTRTGMIRTTTNNQMVTVHPTSVNFQTRPRFGPTHFLLYHSVMMSKRLYAWDTAYVDDLNVLITGGEPEFKYTSRSLYLDHNRIRMATVDPKTLVVIRILRMQLARCLQASYDNPGLPWDKEEETLFALILEALGASRHMARTGKEDPAARR
ncbi:RNA helicase [Malassezia brasiliensis]|uniref:RNA helicase n=1 Tax=Malassezia brasiliensis TaxID=1821822 RepID=A0AAF0DQB0_9BASI|nr:RNA helicase [Malassezia brasiliensis]